VLQTGIRIGEIIREHKLATRVRAKTSCASACFYAFVGGIIRSVDDSGQIGLHMASKAMVDEYPERIRRALLNPNFGDIDSRVRVIIMINEQSAAKAAGLQAVHLVKMGISLRILDRVFETAHFDMYWLKRGELVDFNVVN